MITMSEKIPRFSLKKACPPRTFVNQVSMGPEGGTFWSVSIKTLVIKLESNKNKMAKKRMMKESP
jgi:hypothetical protein